MKTEKMTSKRNNVFKLDLLVLAILKRKDCYGSEIATIINKETGNLFLIKEGVLYPILYRLEQSEFISSSEEIVNRKLRVYYHLTDSGLKELEIMESEFSKKIKAIHVVLRGEDQDEKK